MAAANATLDGQQLADLVELVARRIDPLAFAKDVDLPVVFPGDTPAAAKRRRQQHAKEAAAQIVRVAYPIILEMTAVRLDNMAGSMVRGQRAQGVVLAGKILRAAAAGRGHLQSVAGHHDGADHHNGAAAANGA